MSLAEPQVMPQVQIVVHDIEGYEKVVEATHEPSGLHAIIAVHNSKLGPALGGTRIRPYANREEALEDVLRLAKGMTYKSAIALADSGKGLGGGKSVINADPKKQKSEELLKAFAQVLNSLDGLYICAEDMGSTPEDMAILSKYTKHVSATPAHGSSGDPSPFTAWGVFRAMQAVAMELWGSHSLAGRTVAIQGAGSVGEKLMDSLFWEGARLAVCDVDLEHAHRVACRYGAKVVSVDEIYDVPCDIFAPCAIGGIINDKTIPRLKCRGVVGGANNQLLRPEHGERLMAEGILYAPDYVVNAGGIMNISVEMHGSGYDPYHARILVNSIYDNLREVFDIAKRRGISTSLAAEELAEQKLIFCSEAR